MKRIFRHRPDARRGADNRPAAQPVRSDVLGSYTGLPLDDSRPVQDADDL